MDANALARACADAMWADDAATRSLNVQLISVEPGHAVLAMAVGGPMVNAHGICHGGYIFALAESALAYACNTYNRRSISQHCSITFLAAAELGDTLVAKAVERQRAGLTGVYDVTVTRDEGFVIAEFRGISRIVDGEWVPGAKPRGVRPAKP
ncbi:MAG: hydroxyphenylacetyl-CoA thioesterase PaaI [Xanthobacteraceae bacterium]